MSLQLHGSVCACVAVAGLVATSSVGQVRARLGGIVRMATGEPWSGATIVVHAPGPPGQGDLFDTQTATSDARGRFAVRLLPDRDYVAWAHGQGENGRDLITHLAQGIRPGRPVRLDAERLARPRSALVVEHRERWGSLLAAVDLDRTLFVLLPGPREAGRWDLPPLPGRPSRVSLISEKGCAVWSGRWSDEERGPLTADLPERRPLRLRVVSRGTRRPIAGAIVSRENHAVSSWLHVGQTDGRGELRIETAAPSPRGEFMLAVHAAGFAESVVRAFADHEDTVEASVEVVLRPGPAFRGRILLAPGRPATGIELFVHGSVSDGRNVFSNRLPRRHRVAPDGSFAVPRMQDALRSGPAPYVLYACLDTTSYRALAGDREHLARIVPLRFGHTHDHLVDPEVTDLGDVLLPALPQVDLTVLRPDRTPAPFARLVLLDLDLPEGMDGLRLALRASRAGRARILHPGRRLLLGAGLPQGIATARIGPGRRDGLLLLRLSRSATASGRLVDDDGRGVAGMVSWVPDKGWPHDWRRVLDPSWSFTRTDPDGRFELHLPVSPATYRVAYRGWGTERTYRSLPVRGDKAEWRLVMQ